MTPIPGPLWGIFRVSASPKARAVRFVLGFIVAVEMVSAAALNEPETTETLVLSGKKAFERYTEDGYQEAIDWYKRGAARGRKKKRSD